jgi:hypothetical protein
MSMPSKGPIALKTLVLALLSVSVTPAAEDSAKWISVDFPDDSPVLPVSMNMGATTAHVKGMSMAVDVHASLVLRNVGKKPICGITVRVEAQDLTPAGKGSVSKPSLFVQPGDRFPLDINMELLRPFSSASKNDSPIVQVTLDCALYNDFEAYGPDKLHTKRTLVVYEMQAKRDRQYLAGLLESGQLAQLREELNFGMRDFVPQQLGLEFVLGPRADAGREQEVAVNPVAFRSGLVQAIRGAAQVAGNEVRTPQVQVRNMSKTAVRSLEMGWIVRDERGKEFVSGSVRSATMIGPVQTASMREPGTLRFSRPTGQPMVIGALMTFVNGVEFADGKLWIPSRADIDGATNDPALRRELAISPEEQRLAQIYRRDGMRGLERELKRVN